MTVVMRRRKKHTVKCQNPYFTQVWTGAKTFEIRFNDRGYEGGDTVVLREWNAETQTYSGRYVQATIGTVTGYMQRVQFVVFSLRNCTGVDLSTKENKEPQL